LGASQRAAREAERLPGARGRVGVVVHLGLDGRQPARDAAQLRVQLVDERRHLAATQLAVQDARQVADDATPLVVLDTTDVNGRSHTHTHCALLRHQTQQSSGYRSTQHGDV